MPTPDDLRALARSSPWRWSTLHLHRRSADPCEAWVRRPEDLLVHTPDGRWHRLHEEPERVAPSVVGLTYRTDGLVADRPGPWEVGPGDVMWGSYSWVAMLDPVELASGVELDEVRSQARLGRETWWARARPDEDAYDPWCGCCPLLFSTASERAEHGTSWRPEPGRAYPTTYDVGLDVRTGVVVSVRPRYARDARDAADERWTLELDLLGVDEELDPGLGELFDRHPR